MTDNIIARGAGINAWRQVFGNGWLTALTGAEPGRMPFGDGETR